MPCATHTPGGAGMHADRTGRRFLARQGYARRVPRRSIEVHAGTGVAATRRRRRRRLMHQRYLIDISPAWSSQFRTNSRSLIILA